LYRHGKELIFAETTAVVVATYVSRRCRVDVDERSLMCVQRESGEE
jgi:hypothetical protein